MAGAMDFVNAQKRAEAQAQRAAAHAAEQARIAALPDDASRNTVPCASEGDECGAEPITKRDVVPAQNKQAKGPAQNKVKR